MQSTAPTNSRRTRTTRLLTRSQAFRRLAAVLSVLLVAGSTVHADPVVIRDVIQVIGAAQNPPNLRLRNYSNTGVPVTALVGSRVATPVTSSVNGSSQVNDFSTIDPSGDTLLAGIELSAQDPKGGIQITGDVDGTICDCGEITVADGFPKWPFLFLAVVPIFFIGDDDNPTPTPTPLPTPNPTPPQNTPVPEPSSLLLLGTGLAALGAGVRRRYLKGQTTRNEEQEG